MYRGFNVICDEEFMEDIIDYYTRKGKLLKESNQKIVNESVKSVISNGIIDGSKMQDEWFPTIYADVFISHSHKDIDLAIAMSGWLKEKFGLSSFVDHCIWGYLNKLLKSIDEKYCMRDDGYYDYNKRNNSTSHIHMMLANALTMMIDKSECLFFLNSPNSLSMNDIEQKTMSPWIYYELTTAKYIEKRPPPRVQTPKILQEKFFIEKTGMKIHYAVDFKRFTDLTHDDLNRWDNKYKKEKNRNAYPLDTLYDMRKPTDIH